MVKSVVQVAAEVSLGVAYALLIQKGGMTIVALQQSVNL
jgi:hypothetical protein